MPADQRLEPRNPFAADIDDWLVLQLKFVIDQRVAQRVLDGFPLARLIVHGIGVETVDAAAGVLCRIESQVGVADERGGRDGLSVGDGDPDRRADPNLLPFDCKWLGDAQDDRVGDSRQFCGLRYLRQHDLKFVTAQSAHLPLVADDLRQPRRNLLKQLVADRMPHRIVHRLEAVEVHHQQRARLRTPALPAERAVEQIGNVKAVGETGQRVIAR